MTEAALTRNRMLLINNRGLMRAGLEKLLAEDKTIEVYSLPWVNETTLIQDIWNYRPNSGVLLTEAGAICPLRLLELIDGYGSLRIILVSMQSNVFDVFDRKQIIISSHTELIEQLKCN